MKISQISKPSADNYKPHRCEWGFRNPKNHLSPQSFFELLVNMLHTDDMQHIICPGCGRYIYLSIKIEGHNKTGKERSK